MIQFNILENFKFKFINSLMPRLANIQYYLFKTK
jgi:hypothetical protein